MTEKNKGHVTYRGLLWAGGLAAVPLPPAAAFDHPRDGMPWEPLPKERRREGVTRPVANEKRGRSYENR